MATAQAEIKSQAIELSTKAFETFCENISGMFGVSMKCTRQQSCTETIEGLSKHFQELTAVTLINAKGALNGTFQLIFDQQGLFILGNLMVMPERMASFIEKYTGSQKIAKNIQSGSLKDAEEISDAVSEVGNLMVGSWDRVFREGLDNHEHFNQIRTFIGNPFDKPEEDVDLLPNEELLFVMYEMKASSYPAFTCGAIFPKAVFSDAETEEKIRAEARAKVLAEAGEKAKAETDKKPSEAETKARIEAEERAKVEAEMKAQLEAEEKAGTDTDEKESTQEEKTDAAAESKSEEQTENQENTSEKSDSEDTEMAAQNDNDESKPEEPVEEKAPAVEAAAEQKSDDVDTGEADNVVEAEAATTTQTSESKGQSVSETIRKMAQSPADLPGRLTDISSSICAIDIMEEEVVWGSPDDNVKQTLARMQQADVGYVMIGTDGVLEGIVSKSNMAEAMSPYLRPIFVKWRRPLDDATLNIKVKWMMSRPVHAIKPETPLTAIIENMSQFGGRCLPVVDRAGKVQGLVTVFDIFKVLLNTNPNIAMVGKTLQAPPLVKLDS